MIKAKYADDRWHGPQESMAKKGRSCAQDRPSKACPSPTISGYLARCVPL